MAPDRGERHRYQPSPGYLGFCRDCGKAAFDTRRTARRYARRRYPGEAGLRAYPCPRRIGAWHVGHLAPEIVSGAVSSERFYGPGGIGAHRRRCGNCLNRRGRLR
ncbi:MULTISPECIES: hypothetical protein [unclassified Nocardia]|uniref:hypothetical protein n=1 Tax=unclassified Nocardia TaxID=2637762 RepID=UPI00278C4D34|nr:MULTISPECIES: hypothetical protein [unclassified Nocardia]